MIFRMILLSLLAALTLPGCVKSMAVNALGDALAKGGGAYARDDDPELVRDATAFGLKTIETLLDAEPEHQGLHLAATRGFTQYAYAFLQAEADYIDEDDYKGAVHMRGRALRMYRRARRYGLRGLGLEVDDFAKRLPKKTKKVLAEIEEEQAELLYWTAVSWGAAVALNKDDATLAAGLDLVEAMVKRAEALKPTLGSGAIYDFLLAWDGGRPKAGGGSVVRARAHMARSLEISKGKRLAPLVSFAEIVTVKLKDPKEFDTLIAKALAFDIDSAPNFRMANLVARKRALWLKSTKDDLFLE